MKILLINQNWFKDEWREDGDEVYSVGMTEGFDYRLRSVLDIRDIFKKLPNNFVPDRIVFLDNSAPIYISGLDDIDIPTVFYSVDIHQHYSLHRAYYSLFDNMLVAMKDYVDVLKKEGLENLIWLPLWASRLAKPQDTKEYNSVFVGTLNEKLNPDRVHFFNELKKVTDIYCTQGNWWEIFPKSSMVVNQTVKGDLNFRVFEAMGAGSLLVTEKSSNGLFDLFEDKKHLVTYTKGDVNEARDVINYYVAHQNEAKQIAMQGREEILEKHLARHRADFIKNILNNIKISRNLNRACFTMAVNFFEIYVNVKDVDKPFSCGVLSIAMSYIKKINFDEFIFLKNEYAMILTICVNYDRLFNTNQGMQIASKLQNLDTYNGFKYYKLWKYLNQGKLNEVKDEFPTFFAPEIFPLVNDYITSFII